MNLVLALLAASQPAPSAATPSEPAWLVATIHHSEWCPAGNVRLDLRTGQFALTPGAQRRVCQDESLERPVVMGRLDREQLGQVRAAFRRIDAEGWKQAVCRDGGQPENIVVSNGGTPLLVLTSGAGTGWAPEDLGCWSDAANSLHDLLEEVFRRDRNR